MFHYNVYYYKVNSKHCKNIFFIFNLERTKSVGLVLITC